MTVEEALAAVDDCFEGAFGAAGAEVVIEAYLDGEEASFFCLCDGSNALPLATAQDHKRVGEGDTGVNTGGMGAYSPAPVMTAEMIERTMKEIIEPTIRGMAESGYPFSGVFFAGLMITAKGPELIEYNVRFGDPECQVLMMRLKSDLLPLLLAAAEGTLGKVTAEWSDDPALTVVMASKGYPGSYEKNTPILSLPEAGDGEKVFHAGTSLEGRRACRDRRPCAERDRHRPNSRRGAEARLCAARQGGMGKRFLPPRYRLAGDRARKSLTLARNRPVP